MSGLEQRLEASILVGLKDRMPMCFVFKAVTVLEDVLMHYIFKKFDFAEQSRQRLNIRFANLFTHEILVRALVAVQIRYFVFVSL